MSKAELFRAVDQEEVAELMARCRRDGFIAYSQGRGTKEFGDVTVGQVWVFRHKHWWRRRRVLLQHGRFSDGWKVTLRQVAMWQWQLDYFIDNFGVKFTPIP